MSSRRFIDRGFFKCRELNRADARTRLLAVYLFGEEADDYGRCKDDPYRLMHGCFPDDDLTEADVVKMVDTLEAAGFLSRYYSRDGRPLFWIRRFHDYQPMKYHAASRLDRHPEDDQSNFDKRNKTTEELAPAGYIGTESGGIVRNCPELSGIVRSPATNTNTNTNTKPAQSGPPEGLRAETDAATDMESFDADAVSGVTDADLPDGVRTDAPDSEANGETENTSVKDALREADDPAEAQKAWKRFESITGRYNGKATKGALKAKRQAKGRALDLIQSHEGRIATIGAALQMGTWPTLALKLGKTGPPPDLKLTVRAEAKRVLGLG